MIIIGIDPGTASTGYGIIEKIVPRHRGNKNKEQKNINLFRCLGYGLIKTTPAVPTPERLKKIHQELLKILKTFKPTVLVMESIYFFKNLKTAIPVSQAQGVILLAAAKKKIPVFQYTPLQAKAIVTGYGRAEKKTVQKKIKSLLKLKELPKPDDAADALAIAMAHFLLKKG